MHWDGERIAALECSDGRTRELPLRRRATSSGRRRGGRATTRSATPAACSRSPTPTASSRSPTPTTSRAASSTSSPRSAATPCSATSPATSPSPATTPTAPPTSSSTTAPAASLSLLAGDETRVNFQYDAYGNPVAVTDRKGAVTVQEWDERANLKRRVLPTGVEFTFTHDDADRVLDVTASTGASFRHVYEGDERSPAELIDAEGGSTRLRVEGGLVHAIDRPRRRQPALRLRRRRQPGHRDRRRRQHRAARAQRRGRRDRRDLAARAAHHLRPRRPRPPARAP